MKEVVIGLNGVEEYDIEGIVRNVGVKGLDMDKARELGVFRRIGFLLCAMNATIQAAYRIYGGLEYTFNDMKAYKYDIKNACKQFEKDYEKFLLFWKREKYINTDGVKELNDDSEVLFHQIMKWAQLPERWEVGEEQHLKDNTDTVIKIDLEDKVLSFHRTVLESNLEDDVAEEYCVTCFDDDTKVQTTVERGMDKASAMMSAKRLSSNFPNCIYTASILQTFTEKRTEILPFKVYKAGDVIGKLGKELKKS